jgi:hypothetical protein
VALGAGYGAKGRANSAFIINHQSGKWNFGLSYDNRFAGRTRKATSSRTNFELPAEYYLLQNRHDDRDEQTQNAKMNIGYNGKRNNWGFEVIANTGREDNLETLVSQVLSQDEVFQSKNSRFSSEHTREDVMEYALSYSRKFNDPRKNFSVNLSTSFNLDRENTDITTQSLNSDDTDLGEALLQRTANHQLSDISNVKTDYSLPIGKNAALEMGYKGIYRYTDANYQNLYNINNVYVNNPLASNEFHFREQVHAAYIQFRNYTGTKDSVRWKYDIGLRPEQVFNEGYAVSNGAHVKRDYFNLFPTANIAYYIKQTDHIKFSYSRRINRPNLESLNPFTDITDSLNQHSGNPYLRPELVHSLETGYNKEWKKVSFTINLFCRYANNIIRPYISLLPNGVALTQPMNFGNATTYGAESTLGLFASKYWSSNISGSIFQTNINGSSVNDEISNQGVSWYGKMINNFTLWKESKLQVTGNYNSPVIIPQGSRIAVYNVDMGFQQRVFKSRGAIGLVVTDIFNTQRSGLTASGTDFAYKRTFKVDTRAVLITFAYSFRTKLEEELLENKFSND